MRKDNKTFEDNLKRLHVLSGIKPINEDTRSRVATIVETTKAGGLTYGIVKEGGSYYIKSTASDIINESTLDYIGGEANRREFKYNSYPDALKQLNLIKINLQECSNKMEEPIAEEETAPVMERFNTDIAQDTPPEGNPDMGMPQQQAPAPMSEPSPMPPAPEAQSEPEPAPMPAPEAPAAEPQSPEGNNEFGEEGGEDQIDHY
jgi:hypothetical protein